MNKDMNKELAKHHDYREKTWHISLSDTEEQMAEDRRAQTGLSKAEFGRQALTTARVISRFNENDTKALAELNKIGNNINQLVVICKINGTEKILSRVLDIDEKLTEIYNIIASKI